MVWYEFKQHRWRITDGESHVIVNDKRFRLFHKTNNCLDDNPYLIGFENGIYDLNKNEFRDGVVNESGFITLNDSYEIFKQWCVDTIKKRMFRSMIEDRIASCKRIATGVYGWSGWTLK
jgi:hypothetical protein